MDMEKVETKEVEVDDDGRVRTGTVWTATTHAITAVIGSGVLALPWSVAQMGWVLGPIALIGCAYITYYTAVLLSDCYRTPDPVHGKRNHTYMDVVRSCLGPRNVVVCGLAQYAILWGTMGRRAHGLPPLQGPRRGLRVVRDDVHGGVRPRRGGPVPVPDPGEAHHHLGGRRRHVVHLLLRRAVPERRQARVEPRGTRHPPGRQDWRRRGRLRVDQDVARLAGARQHCLRLHLLHASHRNPGHCEGTTIRERDDEESQLLRHWRDDHLLRVARVYRVRGLRQRRSGERAHRLRRAFLARRRRQRRRGHPLGRSISGVRAADLRVLREVDGCPVAGLGLLPPRVRGAPAPVRRRPRGAVHDVQAGAAHGVRGGHDVGVADAALLQRRARAAGRHRLLAAHGVLPGDHVHRAGKGGARQPQVGSAAGAQRGRTPGFAARRRGLRGRHGAAPGPCHHLPDAALTLNERFRSYRNTLAGRHHTCLYRIFTCDISILVWEPTKYGACKMASHSS